MKLCDNFYCRLPLFYCTEVWSNFRDIMCADTLIWHPFIIFVLCTSRNWCIIIIDLCKLLSPLFSVYRGFFSRTEAWTSWSWLLASILQRHMVLYIHSCIVCAGKTLPPFCILLTSFFCAFLMFYAIVVNESNSASTVIGRINTFFFVSYKPAKWSYIRTHTL